MGFLYPFQVNSQTIEELQIVLPDPVSGAKDFGMGGAVDIDGNYAVVGESKYNGGTGRVYVLFFDGTNWNKIAHLTASDGELGDYLGYAVAIDGNTIVVGANGDDDAGASSGSAYIFVKPATEWEDMTETAKLTGSDLAQSNQFGISVSISGNTIAVGSNYHNSQKGAVYVFEKPDAGWSTMTQTAKLEATGAASGDYLGYSLSIDGNTIAAGAYGRDDSGSNSGCAYIFVKPDEGWTDGYSIARLAASDAAASAYFGKSVSIDNDVVAVGAFGVSSFKGAVYIFEKPTGGWTGTVNNTAKLTESNAANNNRLGYGVSISNNVVIAGTTVSSAYVFKKPDTGWADANETAKLTPSANSSDSQFGKIVAIDGDLIFCSNTADDAIDINSGAVYIYNKPGSGWADKTEDQIVSGDYGILSELYFGRSIAISGNYAVVGQPNSLGNSSSEQKNSGSAYVYEYDGSKWNKIATLSNSELPDTDYFGTSVDIDGNVVIVGAFGEDVRTGAAYLFEKPSGGWVDMIQTARLTATDGASNDYFGVSVSVSGDAAVVGAFKDDDKGTDSGSAYVFEKPSGGWANMTQTVKIAASDEGAGDYFGYDVAVDGNAVAIGAKNNHGRIGAVYVFEKPETGEWSGIVQKAKLTPSDATYNNYLGTSVDISNNVIAAGSGATKSYTYVFEKPIGGWIDMTQTAKLFASNNSTDINSVSISGDVIIAGQQNFNSHTGAAYLFLKTGANWTDIYPETLKITASDGKADDQFGVCVANEGGKILIGASNATDYTINNGKFYYYKLQTSTSVKDNLTENNISVYPNPAYNYLKIDISNTDALGIVIYNVAGQKVLSQNKIDSAETIDISNLPKGSYLLKVKFTNNKCRIVKFIKE